MRKFEAAEDERQITGRIGLFAGGLCSLFCVLISSSGFAADFSFHGFAQGNYSRDTDEHNPDGKQLKWSEERVQLKLEGSQDPFRLFIKEDVFYDHLYREAHAELREGYADYTAGAWDARAGRQIITWGLGDLLFINDIFPKDYESFFSGRPLEYLKKGVDAVKIGAYPGFVSAELVLVPIFEPNTFPDPNRFWMFDPLSGVTNRAEQKPASTAENSEVALRFYRDLMGLDGSLYFYKGYFRQPSVLPDNPMAPTKLTLFYPKLNVYGASLQGRAMDGVVSLEAGYYDSREDRPGTNPMMPNSQTRYLLGYQSQLWEDFTLGLQYYGEYMQDYGAYGQSLPAGFPQDKRLRQLSTVRLTQFLRHQTLRLSFFAFYGISDRDYLINPEVKYNFTDSIWLALGGNFFGGEKAWTQFGQLANNDNVYTQVRYEF
ncbi:MAG: hypothetical protein A2078_03080 [Nitrospirae bacterium GWC2_57_9]|nr:MAG: hypothetical protein A2078_03080 [Nitrospirae bacterium GWC2_57_9]